MGTVAERCFPGLLAAAERDPFCFADFEFDRFETGSGVGTVTERLVGGVSTGAPPVGSRREFEDGGRRGGYFWFFRHDLCSIGIWRLDRAGREKCRGGVVSSPKFVARGVEFNAGWARNRL